MDYYLYYNYKSFPTMERCIYKRNRIKDNTPYFLIDGFNKLF